MKNEKVRLGQVSNVLMELGVNQVDKKGVGEEDSGGIVRVVRMEIGAARKSIRSGKKVT